VDMLVLLFGGVNLLFLLLLATVEISSKVDIGIFVKLSLHVVVTEDGTLAHHSQTVHVVHLHE